MEVGREERAQTQQRGEEKNGTPVGKGWTLSRVADNRLSYSPNTLLGHTYFISPIVIMHGHSGAASTSVSEASAPPEEDNERETVSLLEGFIRPHPSSPAHLISAKRGRWDRRCEGC